MELRVKRSQFIEGMRRAGRLAARTLEHTAKHAVAGITTLELDKIANDYILSNGGIPACVGYRGYPFTICTSLNEVLCHGVPDTIPLRDGDILNIDVTVKLAGLHGDTSMTVAIGEVSQEKRDIIDAARGARDAGIKALRPFGRTGDVGYMTSRWLKDNFPQFMIVEEIGGHGIGTVFHDKPFVPGVGRFAHGEQLLPWTCVTVEPIVWQGQGYVSERIEPAPGFEKCDVQLFRAHGGLATQFEHTVLITDTGFEILTEA